VTETNTRNARILVPVLVGALLTVALGVYGANHKGKSIVFEVSGFENLVVVKSWLTVVAGLFALVQLASALVMYGKVPKVTPPSWTGALHRWSGRVAFFSAVPVGVFCLYGIGFQSYTPRVLAHSLLGCFFFGVFTVKMLVLPKRGLAGWVLPVVGGLTLTALVGVAATSAAWYFANH
jgi:Family of unknown function (DUF6529)